MDTIRRAYALGVTGAMTRPAERIAPDAVAGPILGRAQRATPTIGMAPAAPPTS